ncbi:MAG: 5-(carboxyamino)imidazole ribonucleotide synthase [Leptospirales bacterium]
MILPGSTLGVLGGGQLGRMFAIAARTMGYRVVTWDPDPFSPAKDFSSVHIDAGFEDENGIGYFLKHVQAVTTEFENVPTETLRKLSEHMRVIPSAESVGICQDRILEKTFLTNAGIPVPEFVAILDRKDLEKAFQKTGTPALLKRSRWGYDGKGQALVKNMAEALAAFGSWGEVPCILEQKVPFSHEISIILARNHQGEIRSFPIAENWHSHGVLETTAVPAQTSEASGQKAMLLSEIIVTKLAYEGILAIEFFVLEDERVLVNEMAPRPHNSGHFTLDACTTDQFEQQVRVLCGLPLGGTKLISPVVMGNIMGDLWKGGEPDWSILLSEENLKLHLYGKSTSRPGRKMGHFSILDKNIETTREKARTILLKLASYKAP